jgi:hypothetical protein
MKAKAIEKLKLIVGGIAIFAAIISMYIAFGPYVVYSLYEPEEGDIVFQSLNSNSDLVLAIEGVTSSKYSHVGVVFKSNGNWYVKEALGDVHDTKLLNWIKQGRGFEVGVYRFKAQHREQIPIFLAALKKYQYQLYDFQYKLDDEDIYCSELPYRAYKDATGFELGKLSKLGELNWKPYKATIEKYEEGPVPLERHIITPVALSQAEQLYHVQTIGMQVRL